ncbi:MAG: hypothetical protein AAB511_02945 [Patescibacteria group bacterium]
MEILNEYPKTSVLFFFLTAAVLFWRIVAFNNRLQQEIIAANDSAAEKKVKEILESIGWEGKQRWINDREIEFVSIVCGLQPEHHKVWARVRVTQTSLSVVVENSYDATVTERDWATMIAAQFHARGITVTTRTADRQPRPEEIYVPAPPVHNEFDGPNSPFS